MGRADVADVCSLSQHQSGAGGIGIMAVGHDDPLFCLLLKVASGAGGGEDSATEAHEILKASGIKAGIDVCCA